MGRFGESRPNAKELKAKLEEHGKKCFLCSELPGQDLVDVIYTNFHHATLIIVMGTETYGLKSTSAAISTYDEMKYIRTARKPFFLVKMCKEFQLAATKAHFPDDMVYYQWMPEDPLPDGLVQKILQKLAELDEQKSKMKKAESEAMGDASKELRGLAADGPGGT